MGLIIDGVSPQDLILDGRSVSLYVGGNPPTKVWPTRDTVQITLGTELEARDQFRAALADRGLDYTTITEIPFDIELVGTGTTRGMFSSCSELTTVPEMDTSQVTNMRSMFNGCSSLTTVPWMDTSQVTHMGWMFQDCTSLTSVPEMDTSNVTDMSSMFRACSALTDGNVRLIGRHPQVDTTDMILNSGLTFQPFVETVQITLGAGFAARDQFRAALTARGLDYATITEIPFGIELVGAGEAIQLFRGCVALATVPPLDTSQVTNMNGFFQECASLVTVPPLDTSNVERAPSMFAYCRSLTSVPTMDAAKLIDVTNMFTGCTALTDGNVLLTNRNPAVNSTNMITSSGLTREPWDTVAPPVARTVTINGGPNGWDQATATGDTGLIQEWIEGNRVRFHAPTRCSQRVYNATTGLVLVNAGDMIPAGAPVQPLSYNGPYVFTEVL